MSLMPLITDNISELLVKIIEFTQSRQKVLILNINNMDYPGFVPKDLAVEEFSELLNKALDEHSQSQCLLLYDTENIKFGAAGSFEVKPAVDKYAKELLEENQEEYLELQTNKLWENSLNQKVAAELLRQKTSSDFNFGVTVN
jgi:flagellar basal body rod protein FlgB